MNARHSSALKFLRWAWGIAAGLLLASGVWQLYGDWPGGWLWAQVRDRV